MNRICETCFERIDQDVDFGKHSELCRQEQMVALSQYFQNNQDGVNGKFEPKIEKIVEPIYPKLELTKTQKQAIRFFRKKAKLMSRGTHHLLFEKILSMGFDEGDLDILLNFVSQAPIIAFVPLYGFNLFDNFFEEPRMKNLFEVNRGRGSTSIGMRANWESTLFNKFYDKSEPIERVKYGAFNIDTNPLGVISAQSYGDVYFVFNDDVKKRTTMVYGDSAGNAQNLHIATPDNFINILHYMPEHVVKSIILKAKGLPFNYENYPYIEIQIHGEIRLDRDVKQIVVDPRKIQIDNRLEDLAREFNIEIVRL